MDTIIGIDLGTSTSEAAVFRDGKPVRIPNLSGQVIIPSAVGIDTFGNWVVGERARAQFLLAPENTAIEIKRGIGRLQTFSIGKKQYSAVELSAKILDYIRTYVSEHLGEEINRAVISVPAYFDDIQRQQTVEAGRLAGFQVDRILNEPTAAAMSYGLDHMEEESHILVYDLGGGTFDVTLLEMFEGVLEVKASNGDNQLGGKDFDERLVDYLVRLCRSHYNIDPSEDRHAMVALKEEAEKCKIALSEEESCQVIIPALMRKEDRVISVDVTVTRREFEEMTKDLLVRTHAPIQVVLEDSGLTEQDIDRIILVGGSTRMPMVAKDIQSFLHKEPEPAVDPDFAVAEGAAIMAGIISGEITPEEGLVMMDVNPYTLGIRTVDGYSFDRMSVLIPRNVSIPVTKEDTYSTFSDYQTEARIEVYQGESRVASSNHFLGHFNIGGIPPKKAGIEKIVVRFSYDLNGMLGVTATIPSTGQNASITIDMKDSAEAEGSSRFDLEKWKDVKLAGKYRAVMRRAEKKLSQLTEKDEDRKLLSAAIDSLKEAIIVEDEIYCQDAEQKLLRIMTEVFGM